MLDALEYTYFRLILQNICHHILNFLRQVGFHICEWQHKPDIFWNKIYGNLPNKLIKMHLYLNKISNFLSIEKRKYVTGFILLYIHLLYFLIFLAQHSKQNGISVCYLSASVSPKNDLLETCCTLRINKRMHRRAGPHN